MIQHLIYSNDISRSHEKNDRNGNDITSRTIYVIWCVQVWVRSHRKNDSGVARELFWRPLPPSVISLWIVSKRRVLKYSYVLAYKWNRCRALNKSVIADACTRALRRRLHPQPLDWRLLYQCLNARRKPTPPPQPPPTHFLHARRTLLIHYFSLCRASTRRKNLIFPV